MAYLKKVFDLCSDLETILGLVVPLQVLVDLKYIAVQG